MTSIFELNIIAEGKVAELFSIIGRLDSELQLAIIKDIRRRIENLK